MTKEERKEKLKDVADYICKKEKENKICFLSFEGLNEIDIDDFLKQPLSGMLYDLNRSPEVILTFIDDKKWVNDYACMLIIKKLYEKLKENKLL